jgi:pimeloyl-ACP methyl ester carboxylesterase
MTAPPLEPVVFLPDRFCDARVFLDQIVGLSGQQAVMVAPLPAVETVAAMAREILPDLPQVCALVGLGLGGAVAVELVRLAPDRFSRLALISTDPLPEPPRVAAAREPRIARVRAGRLDDVLAEDLAPDQFAPVDHLSSQLATMRDVGLAQGPDTYVAHARAVQRRPDLQSALRRLDLPVLVIAGEDDRVTPARRQALMADLLPWSEMVTLPGAGHIPNWDQPDLTTAALKAWMQIGR